MTHNAHPGFAGADLGGIWRQVPWNSDSLTVLLLQLTDRTIKPKMNPQGLLCGCCFVYKPKNEVTLPRISTMETFTRRNIHSG